MIIEGGEERVHLYELACGDSFVYDGDIWMKTDDSGGWGKNLSAVCKSNGVTIVRLRDGHAHVVSSNLLVMSRFVNVHKIVRRS